ncbi:MAG: acyl carrier protein [Candidatus Marinimicrobia bacterium]|nr:acyl carrier protein [Candidatus Neomarinimicrobiota bacterium]
MDKKEVQEQVIGVVAKVLKMDASAISQDANFIFDLGADSMQSLELIAGFEEEFNIEMDEDKAQAVQTVSDAVEFIHSYL